MERKLDYEKAWQIGERIGKGILALDSMLYIFRAVLVAFLALNGITFAAQDLGGIDPACNAAKKASGMWGLIKISITGAVVLALLIGSGAMLMERRGGWAGVLFFASFIIGGVVWVVLNALGEQISNYANSCESGNV